MAKQRLLTEMLDTARGLYDLGVMNIKTLRELETLGLPYLKSFGPSEIKRLRLKSRTSQAVFAAYLNTSPSTVRKWEIGEKKPGGTALKLLNLVERKGLGALI